MGWFRRGKDSRAMQIHSRNVWSLQEAVDQARVDWQNAHHLMNRSEGNAQIDNGIYYLKLVEKRYMYLLNQARAKQG